MKAQYGVYSMPETAENVAIDYRIEREEQDCMALASQLKVVATQQAGHLAAEITPVTIAQKKGDPPIVSLDEHLRAAAGQRGGGRAPGPDTARPCGVWWAWPLPVWRHASWASARRQPPARCWNSPA